MYILFIFGLWSKYNTNADIHVVDGEGLNIGVMIWLLLPNFKEILNFFRKKEKKRREKSNIKHGGRSWSENREFLVKNSRVGIYFWHAISMMKIVRKIQEIKLQKNYQINRIKEDCTKIIKSKKLHTYGRLKTCI